MFLQKVLFNYFLPTNQLFPVFFTGAEEAANQERITKLCLKSYSLSTNSSQHRDSPLFSFHPEWLQRYLLLSTKILPLQQKTVVGLGVQNEQNINDEVKTQARP